MNARSFLAFVVVFAPSWALAQEANSEATKAYIAAHEKMMQQMQGMKHTGDPDKDFVMMMMPHHQGAIDMAKVELQYGKDSKLRGMAEKIIADQEKEIAEMKQWQAEHGM